jgi:hypothetical protein
LRCKRALRTRAAALGRGVGVIGEHAAMHHRANDAESGRRPPRLLSSASAVRAAAGSTLAQPSVRLRAAGRASTGALLQRSACLTLVAPRGERPALPALLQRAACSADAGRRWSSSAVLHSRSFSSCAAREPICIGLTLRADQE